MMAWTGAVVLASCAAQPPQDGASGAAFLANETVAITRACIAGGFVPETTAAALRARGFVQAGPLSPMLAKADPQATVLTAARIAVPAQGRCEVVVEGHQIALVRSAMRNALISEGFARDRSASTEVWTRPGLRLTLDRNARPTPRYLPNNAALRLERLS